MIKIIDKDMSKMLDEVFGEILKKKRINTQMFHRF